MRLNLPADFLNRMRTMLGEEYEAFQKSYEEERQYGLRVNTRKISCEEFESICPFPIKKIPWVPNGYFYPSEVRPSLHPYYRAGLYYLQEPSAMTPAACLPVTPGEAVLDLCAAPGGKATELATKLAGQGILVANDISASRARALLRNLELFGASNIFVTNEIPEKMTRYFPEFFHKILLDAPCSGEGMFRKDDSLAADWSVEKSENLSKLQKELILTASKMLMPGGLLLYSTCTIAPAEDEEIISFLLNQRNDMHLVSLPDYPGFSSGVPEWADQNPELAKCVRIWPHKMNGEGHFLALLKKEGEPNSLVPIKKKPQIDKGSRKLLETFFQDLGLSWDFQRVEVRNDKVYLLPPVEQANLRGIHFLRNGLYLGDLKKNRFEPSQPLALALKGKSIPSLRLSPEDDRLHKYLRGETLIVAPGETQKSKGWQLVCADEYPLGWGKLVGQTLKNKYPAGWRL